MSSRAFRTFLMAGTMLAGLAAPALAGGSIKDAPVAAPTHTGFGEIMGMYGFSAEKDWQLFGPAVIGPPEMTKAGLGDGGVGRVMAGVHFGTWDVAAALQLGRFAKGSPSEGGGEIGTLSADMFAVDAMVGYRFQFGAAASRLAIGVRHAGWDNEVDPGANRQVKHEWSGTGPRIEWALRAPISSGMSLHADIGASYLFGDIKTSASGGWICDDCTNYSANSVNVDGRIGLAFPLGGGDLVLGYRAEYWSNVNVKITDNTDFGGNEGRSAAIVHGPFVALKLGLAP